jgi:hypothetical protein
MRFAYPFGHVATVVCHECEQSYELSDRRERELRRRGQETICSDCRRPPPVLLTDEERERLGTWWVEQLGSLDACRKLAGAIWL